MPISAFHALCIANELSALHRDADRLISAYMSSDVKVFPYQVLAAMFALRSPYVEGAILADEGGLGKTYEALLIISQLWFEGKEHMLIVVPIPLLGERLEEGDSQRIQIVTYRRAYAKFNYGFVWADLVY
ncbi:hypothetical protein AGMMS49975_16770 [Clostridia bacterium]|nr:hypothetical protein AGMMS49975_16770 [Clostridia bacterium]